MIKINDNLTKSFTTKKLKKGKYYFRIRAEFGKSHSPWSEVKSLKVK